MMRFIVKFLKFLNIAGGGHPEYKKQWELKNPIRCRVETHGPDEKAVRVECAGSVSWRLYQPTTLASGEMVTVVRETSTHVRIVKLGW